MTANELWAHYCAFSGTESNTPYDAWAFCGGGPLADELGELVLQGTKTATASSYIAYQTEGAPLPEAGCYSVVLGQNGQALCVIRDTRVSLVPFLEVSPNHAWREGEGDRSLAYWRQVHRRFLGQDYAALGKPFDEQGLCVLEEFEKVFPI